MTSGQQDWGNGHSTNKSNTFIPTFDQAFYEVKPFYIHLYSSLEEGIRLALHFFNDLKAPIDVFVLNDLIRYHTKGFLKQKHGIELGDDYEIGDLGNNSLTGTYKGYGVRVLKAFNGGLPLANSVAKAQYFSQQLSFSFGDILSPARRPNIVFVWDLSGTYSLKPINMCCPEHAEKGRGILSVYWNEPLPHPAELIKPDTRPAEEPQEIDIRPKEGVDDSKDTNDVRREDQTGQGTKGSDSE